MPHDPPPLEPAPEYFLDPQERKDMERVFLHAAVTVAAQRSGLVVDEHVLKDFCNELTHALGMDKPGLRPN